MHGDFHAEKIDDDLVGGVSPLSGYISKVRQEEKNVLYAIAGDMVSFAKWYLRCNTPEEPAIFSFLINSNQKQEKSALERLKSSQELDKTDEISMALWYSVLQVVLYPLLGLIMRGICYGSFLQEVVQIID